MIEFVPAGGSKPAFRFRRNRSSHSYDHELVEPMSTAICIVFGVWFGAQVLAQLPSPRFRLRPPPSIRHLLPRWHFFAPKPIQGDFIVRYRTAAVSEDFRGRWTMVSGYPSRRLHHTLIFPGRRAHRALFECCRQITVMHRRKQVSSQLAILLSPAYMLLLEHVSAVSGVGEHEKLQFRIEVSKRTDSGSERRLVAFQSLVHQSLLTSIQ